MNGHLFWTTECFLYSHYCNQVMESIPITFNNILHLLIMLIFVRSRSCQGVSHTFICTWHFCFPNFLRKKTIWESWKKKFHPCYYPFLLYFLLEFCHSCSGSWDISKNMLGVKIDPNIINFLGFDYIIDQTKLPHWSHQDIKNDGSFIIIGQFWQNNRN